VGNEIVTELKVNDQTTSALERAKKSMNSIGSTIGSSLTIAAGGFAAVAAGAGFLVKSAMDAEQQHAKLEAVLKATGHAAGYSADQLSEMASQFQETTVFEGDAVEGAMAVLASFKEIKGDQFKEATQAAMDMATVMGGDLNGAMTQLGKALNDPMEGMAALSRSGVSFTEDQKKMVAQLQKSGDIVGAQKIILAELKGEFGGAAEAMGNTFGGKVTQLWNKLGDLGEAIGGAIIPALSGLVDWLGNAVGWMADNEEAIQEWTSALMDVGKSIVEWLVPKLKDLAAVGIAAFTFLEVYAGGWQDTMKLAMTAVEYYAVKAFNTISYYLTDVVPQYLQWFADNWINILTDLMNAAAAIFGNMGENIKSFFKGFWNWLQGGAFDFKWTKLLDGFESTLEELPQIAERKMGPLEASLGKQMGELSGKLGDEFQTKLAERLTAFGLVDGVDSGAATGGKGKKGVDLTPKLGGDKYKYGGKAEGGKGGSGFEDLSSLYKRIAGAAGKDPAAKTAENTDELVKNSKEQTSSLKTIAGRGIAPTPLNTGTPGWATEEM
jgi:hypothetical protein